MESGCQNTALSFGALAARVRPGHIGPMVANREQWQDGHRRARGHPALATATSLGAPRGDGPSELADPTVAATPAALLSVGGGNARDLGGVLRRAEVAPEPERTHECQ